MSRKDNFPKAYIKDAQAGIVEVRPKREKVAIVGAGTTRTSAPYDDPEWEIFGLNEISQKRADRWFELHPLSVQSEAELEWLKNCTTPVYLIETDAEKVPYGVKFPLDEILQQPWAKDYFTCTFAYQIALAIYEGFKEIGLWGLRLRQGTPREQTIEQMCVEWWLGLAQGLGIKITTCPDDGLVSHPCRYGYDYWLELHYVQGRMATLGRQVYLDRHICSFPQTEVGTATYYSFSQ